MNSPRIDQVASGKAASFSRTGRPIFPLLVLLWLGYLILALIIRRKPLLESDIRLTHSIQSSDHPILERFMTFVSWFGFRPQSLILPLSAVLICWIRQRRIEAVLLFVAWTSSTMSFLTKQFVRRPRPDNSIVRVVIAKTRDTSFPSGHVVHYTTFWGFATYLLLSRPAPSPLHWVARLFMLPIIALVGPSRIYLGHHWATDVTGSYLLGSAWLVGLIGAHRILREAAGEVDEPSSSAWTAGAQQWLR